MAALSFAGTEEGGALIARLGKTAAGRSTAESIYIVSKTFGIALAESKELAVKVESARGIGLE
jgi:hypothetical protein